MARPPLGFLPTLMLVGLLPIWAGGESGPPSTSAEELIRAEKQRLQVESILEEINTPTTHERDIVGASERLASLGTVAVPYLATEIEHPRLSSYPTATLALGLIGTPEAVDALRESIGRLDEQADKLAGVLKTWPVYGLAIAGVAEAVDLCDSGPLETGGSPMMDGVALTELAARLTAPRSVPLLLDQLERYGAKEELYPRLDRTLAALGGVADPSTAPRIVPFLKHSRWQIRQEAARALGRLGDPSTAENLIAALDDADPRVAPAAAMALRELKPALKVKALLARLETETNTSIRIPIYRTLADIGGESMLEAFQAYWGRPMYTDRLGIVTAVGRLRSPKGLNLLRAALADEDMGVVLRAMDSLRRVGGPGARETLLASLNDARWLVEEAAAGILALWREPRAGSRITERLLRQELVEGGPDPSHRAERVNTLGDALVELRYVDAAAPLRAAQSRQTDPEIRAYLTGLVRRLTVIGEYKGDVSKWGAAAGDEDLSMRRLAYSRLGDLGGRKAARALKEAFGRSEQDEGVEILRRLASVPARESVALIERVLTDPAFDARERRPLRDMAAWSARRLGGKRMVAALRSSAVRRDGREASVLASLAFLTGKDSIPMLRALRSVRFRHYDWDMGKDQEYLDRILREVTAGRPIGYLDLAPGELEPY